ncbi:MULTISPECIES: hypothetical protein [Moorena]|uniref:Uncharacterized protein n=1 Tax=Moorena producens 3L TaxID=489825 RepID=F4XJ59_9CYAN|nr:MULTISPECIES: hypothetical protein [Moorena]EGJ35139.1 hypothetical protein LYNGBM3L_07570 [Moorena producens 3L]NEP65022.1 hypothetical protein [Moorena sp. SIO3A5]OLT65201.1 hypothetical protein BI334_09270 [Moorena producens 3L]
MLNFNQFWSKLLHKIPSIGKFFMLMALSSSLVLMFFLTPSIAQFTPQQQLPTEEGSETQSSPEIGWEFLGSRELNQTEITEIEYEGECPGNKSFYREARFTSSETPPAPGRRVVVRTVTRGVASDPYPYTDREYDQGRSSEATRMAFGTRHSSRKLHVLDGDNEFEYEIKEGDSIIDSGVFTAVIEKLADVRRRDAESSTESVCMNSEVPNYLCADIRTRTEYTCPGSSRVIRTVFEPNNTKITTLISNQTPLSVKFWINDTIQTLSSGKHNMYTKNFLTIEFTSCYVRRGRRINPEECTNQTMSLQPGKRYRFKLSKLDSGFLNLEDFPR